MQPEDTTVVEGTMAILRCSPHLSVPAAVVSWTHNGRVLDTSTRLRIAPSGNLYILEPRLSDVGRYQCIASNAITGARRRSEEATLTVNGKHPTSLNTHTHTHVHTHIHTHCAMILYFVSMLHEFCVERLLYGS